MTDAHNTPCPTPALRRERRRYPDGCHLAEDASRDAADAADAAVGKVFAILGVDLGDPAAVEEFRKDLRVAGSLRRAVDKSMMAAFVAIVLFGFALAGASLLEKLKLR